MSTGSILQMTRGFKAGKTPDYLFVYSYILTSFNTTWLLTDIQERYFWNTKQWKKEHVAHPKGL